VAAAPAIIRREVEEQKLRDLDRGGWQGALMARMGAVVEAQRLIRLHESAATPAFRQALIDLASVSELLAAELPAPSLAQEAAYPARLAVWQERRGSAWVYFCFSRKAEVQPARH
jgi:hypothetical protein